MHLYSVGHSNRSLRDFLIILEKNGIRTLADVRRFPGSKRHPHFGGESLAIAVEERDIRYVHIPQLGGRRSGNGTSMNTFWQNSSFRAYADHMNTAEFHEGIERLLHAEQPVAFCCAEALPWQCHRQLISDEIVRRGGRVTHLLSATATEEHRMNAAAVDCGDHLEYRGLF